jgi:hypothetical protein
MTAAEIVGGLRALQLLVIGIGIGFAVGFLVAAALATAKITDILQQRMMDEMKKYDDDRSANPKSGL